MLSQCSLEWGGKFFETLEISRRSSDSTLIMQLFPFIFIISINSNQLLRFRDDLASVFRISIYFSLNIALKPLLSSVRLNEDDRNEVVNYRRVQRNWVNVFRTKNSNKPVDCLPSWCALMISHHFQSHWMIFLASREHFRLSIWLTCFDQEVSTLREYWEVIRTKFIS